MNRRGFLSGIIALCAAPAIVRVGSLMPVRVPLITSPLLTPTEITRAALKILHEKLDFVSVINHQYDTEAMRVGSVLKIRLPNQWQTTNWLVTHTTGSAA